jgi:hypothetical protein
MSTAEEILPLREMNTTSLAKVGARRLILIDNTLRTISPDQTSDSNSASHYLEATGMTDWSVPMQYWTSDGRRWLNAHMAVRQAVNGKLSVSINQNGPVGGSGVTWLAVRVSEDSYWPSMAAILDSHLIRLTSVLGWKLAVFIFWEHRRRTA